MIRRLRSQLFVLSLEDRTAPATFTVLNLNDSGADSLRDCISKANSAAGADTIDFTAGLAGTITLTSGEIAINQDIKIIGPGSTILTVSGNNASRIFNTTAAPTAAAVSIANLTLTAGNAGFLQVGGAISGEDENLTLTDCTLTASTAFRGGALHMSNGTLTATRCTITGNLATSTSGGINITGGGSKAVIRSSTISGNSALMHGGIYATGYLNMTDTTVSGNSATSDFGGGIVVRGAFATGALTIRNCTISGNSAKTDGGGVWVEGTGTLVVQNSTIANNSASGIGGGIRRAGYTAIISLESTIVSGNANATVPDISSGGLVAVKTSAIGSGTGFTLNDQGGNLAFGTELKLGTLQNNGGPTLTHFPASDSPLNDAGSNPATLTTDQRGPGFPRVIGVPDIGSVETRSIVVSNTKDAGAGSLRQAVLNANAQAGADVVSFAAAVFGMPQTIKLTTGEIAISAAVTIAGPAGKVTIDGNATSRIFNTSGAAIGSAIMILDLTLTNGKDAAAGGAILVNDESIALTNVTIKNCTASAAGGAINTSTGTVTLNGCTITGNSVSGTASVGGGINTALGTVVVTSSTISGNTAGRNGGGIYFFSGGKLVMDDSTVSGNKANTLTAGVGGGGIYLNNTNATIRNSTISGNSATNGGGIVGFGGTSFIQNSTIVFNTATTGGGGIRSDLGSIESTIVSNNSAPTGPDINGTVETMNYSLVGNAAGLTISKGSSNLLNMEAKLKALAANGGSTQTHLPNGDSPVFNRGSNPGALSFDQRGGSFPRVLQGSSDIGAVESVGVNPVAAATALDVTAAAGTVHTITVTYSDDVGIKTATLGSSDITVNGPGGAIPVVFTGFTGGGTLVTATYDFVPPGGAWDKHDFGTYMVTMNPGEVSDTDGTSHTVAPGNVGSFRVIIAFDPVVTLTSDEDDGNVAANDISLREAIDIANAVAGTQLVTFDPAVFGTPQTILQTLGEIAVTDSITIAGAVAQLTIDANGKSRHFDISGSAILSVDISQMTLVNGNAGFGRGGSIRVADEVVTLSKMTLTGNVAFSGGALSLSAATSKVTIQDCIFAKNTAQGGNGGAINVDATGSLTIARTTLSGNSAGINGGAIYFFSGGSLNMTESTVSGNTSNATSSAVGGGGIYFFGTVSAGGFTITNSTISGNTTLQSGAGGGIVLALFAGNALIRNSTIKGNNATTAGGGIARTSGAGTLTLQSTIVAGNTVAGANNAKSDLSFDAAANVAGDNNLIGIMDAANNATLTGSSNLTGSLATPRDAKLGPLANNDGPTLTHALLAGSPAIDSGNNVTGLSFDQRGPGFLRLFGSKADIGAFEVQPPPAVAKVSSVQINDATPQRSRVTSLKITFDNPPSLPATTADGFQLKRQSDNAVVTCAATPSGNTVTLTFTGGPVDFGSLADGRYTLTALASKILNLDGNGDGTPGDDFVLIGTPANGLFRLFGDADGNGTINTADFNAFRLAFGGSSTIFDFDNAGGVGTFDFNQFRQRFGSSV